MLSKKPVFENINNKICRNIHKLSKRFLKEVKFKDIFHRYLFIKLYKNIDYFLVVICKGLILSNFFLLNKTFTHFTQD